MYITIDTIMSVSGLIIALISIFTIIFSVYKWYLRQRQQDIDIAELKKELCLTCYGILACLKELKKQGCNESVNEAMNELEKYINKEAHK